MGAPQCTLSYRHFHLLWTIPTTLLLYLVNRPFLTRLDRVKLIVLPIIAFVWTTPWDNVIVKNRAWSYHDGCVWFTLGYVPIEEYFFFLIQSVMTTLWTSFLTRWSIPIVVFGIRSSRRSAHLPVPLNFAASCWLPLAILLAGAFGALASDPDRKTYYLGMISWWSSIPLALLLWGTLGFVSSSGTRVFLLSFSAPTVYLWASDIYALRRGTWHINELTSLEVFPLPDLPIEEMLFFLVTNLILVSACFAFDRCVAICRFQDTHGAGANVVLAPSPPPPISPSYLPINISTFLKLWGAFVGEDPSPSSSVLRAEDLRASLAILSKASKSFSSASLLLPWDLRSDLGSLYAFCRVADDLVDESDDNRSGDRSEIDKRSRIALIRQVLSIIYSISDDACKAEGSDTEGGRVGRIKRELGHARRIGEDALENLRAASCSIVEISRILPIRLWEEMLRGYEMDLELEGWVAKDGVGTSGEKERRGFETLEELVDYSQCVAGCVGEMCVRVILSRKGLEIPLGLQVERRLGISVGPEEAEGDNEEKGRVVADEGGEFDLDQILFQARRMGVSLQLVNIARDVIEDSVQLGRCYLPLELIEEMAKELQEALLNGRIRVSSRVVSPGEEEEEYKAGVRAEDVRPHVMETLMLGERLFQSSYPSLSKIPDLPSKVGLRAACSVYFAIGERIRSQDEEEVREGRRAKLSKVARFGVALRSIYLGW
ncbi:hypothetical protein IE53DRAFT_311565 [Violaceomyces palustris]|uniref:Uncharacterized protein n=1 Tax=Violaceomyces palustris TaxID=1673888 RepID=A0ACD0P3U2_9BASI|nr:hypothetical protein IE53DRAFT_311565 [Violaceomyces palustris]